MSISDMSTLDSNNEQHDDLSGHLVKHSGPGFPRNPFASSTLYPTIKLMWVSLHRILTHQDLWPLRADLASPHIFMTKRDDWHHQLRQSHPNIIKTLLKAFQFQIIICISLQIGFALLQFATPLLLPYIILYLMYQEVPMWYGYLYTGGVFLAGMSAPFLFNVNCYEIYKLGIKIRSFLTILIFEKSLTAVPNPRYTRGVLMNMISTDAQLLLDTLPVFVFGLAAPIQFLIAIILLYKSIRWFCFTPVVIFSISLPLILNQSRKIPRCRFKIQSAADHRVKLISEFISSIRIVKYYAWERPLTNNITKSREIEIQFLRQLALIRSKLLMILLSVPSASLYVTSILYITLGESKLANLFTALSYISILRFPFIYFPLTLTFATQYQVCLKRIQDFLLIPDLEPQQFSYQEDGGISITNGDFSWDYTSPQPNLSLRNINLNIPKGSLVAIIGNVGSGKTSLAMAFLSEIRLVAGQVCIPSEISYASQDSFIMNTTIRTNITFGLPYDPERYQKVIDACMLLPDLALFPSRDLTEVAEQGSNLSGGQRQRINIARTMYANRQVYLFDDPLSSVDPSVAEQMFQKVILALANSGKTVIIVLNQLHFLPNVDHIVMMSDQSIAEQGDFAQLISARGEFYQLLKKYGLDRTKKQRQSSSQDIISNFKISNDDMKQDDLNDRSKVESMQVSLFSAMSKKQIAKEKQYELEGMLTTEEEVSHGVVSWMVYLFYLSSGSLFLYAQITLFNFLRVSAMVSSTVWLAFITESQASPSRRILDISIYCIIFLIEVISTSIGFALFVKFAINSSRNIHNALVNKISTASTSFFDKTPMGRLVARFSKDINYVDSLLPWQLEQSSALLFIILAAFVNLAIGSYYALIISLVGFISVILMLIPYRRTVMQIQRLESISRAPIFSNFSETLSGLTTIRAFQMTKKFSALNYNKLDYNSLDFLALRRLMQWFSLVTSEFLNGIVGLVFLTFVILRNVSMSSIVIELATNALSNSVLLVNMLSAFNFNFIELEARMNAIERIMDYDQVEHESPHEIPEERPDPSWPDQGVIQFQDLVVEYKPGTPVLKNLTFSIRSHEKIGIVGRTGAGKSTLITSLFRTIEPLSGQILIDGVDISRLGLYDLRSKLSIIPQVPQLFLGTIRYNLDPTNEHNDDEIWHALRLVSLDEVVKKMPENLGLDELVQDNSSNFSFGQRQLLNIARVLLRKTHILLLDEATASLDTESDALLQRMIRKHFSGRTVVTIAHRLITIIDCDRVLVLDSGRAVEFGSPRSLLKKRSGHFYNLVQSTGAKTAKHLTKMAKHKISVIDAIEQEPDLLDASTLSELE